MGGPVEVAGDQLRTIVERIEHVESALSVSTRARRH
jgi:hypothetical protein